MVIARKKRVEPLSKWMEDSMRLPAAGSLVQMSTCMWSTGSRDRDVHACRDVLTWSSPYRSR
jgi:hypothetical protein